MLEADPQQVLIKNNTPNSTIARPHRVDKQNWGGIFEKEQCDSGDTAHHRARSKIPPQHSKIVPHVTGRERILTV
jgi:hypothetical protein